MSVRSGVIPFAAQYRYALSNGRGRLESGFCAKRKPVALPGRSGSDRGESTVCARAGYAPSGWAPRSDMRATSAEAGRR